MDLKEKVKTIHPPGRNILKTIWIETLDGFTCLLVPSLFPNPKADLRLLPRTTFMQMLTLMLNFLLGSWAGEWLSNRFSGSNEQNFLFLRDTGQDGILSYFIVISYMITCSTFKTKVLLISLLTIVTTLQQH